MMTMTAVTFKEESSWMAYALTRLVDFSAQKSKHINYSQFADAVAEFLCADFFQYQAILIYNYNFDDTEWRLLSQRCPEEHFPDVPIDRVPVFAEDKTWTEGKYLYKFFKMDGDCNLLILSSGEEPPAFSEYEFSFLTMMVTLADAFFHMKKLSREMQEKVIEITNIRTSRKIINGLEEGNMTLDDAALELYELLSLEGVVLAVPDGNGGFKVTLTRGSGITTWDEFVALLQNTGDQSEYLEVFSLVDTRRFNYGIISCRLSEDNPALYDLQLRVLEYIIPQVTLVLSELRMSREAVTDPLTGLYNRRYVEDALKNREYAVKTDPRFSLSVLMVDVDHFKQVNDTYGHKAGDEVLKTIASVITQAVREVDVVGRYGGEEIIILMLAEFDIAKKAAERIRRNVENTEIHTASKKICVTLSIGVAEFTPADSHEQVVQRADENLYKAKNAGRNLVAY
ncbi:MAG: GGDEF domain-containing protein [bacterium]|nr:GGDEF domain-containing protein [bacterium]